MGISKYEFPEGTLFLVTGGAGFIGSNIAQAIHEMGYRVRVLDNFSTGNKDNIADLEDSDRFELIEGDIRDLDTCYKACEGVQYVLHHAALGSVPASIEDPKTSNDINVTGTLNMLIAAKDSKVRRFIYASSSAIYGDENSPEKVEEKTGRLLSPYGVTKMINELYAENFFNLYGLQTIGLRYFNVFGRRQNPNSVYAAVIPIFVKKLLIDEAPVIYGDGSQSRDFVYIDNVIEANLAACLADECVCGQAYNIGCGSRMQLNDLYNIISMLVKKNISPRYEQERTGDIKHSAASIKKAIDKLGYQPRVKVAEGLEKSIQWYRSNL